MLFKKEKTINDRRLHDYFPTAFMLAMFGIYAFLSFYEVYINQTIGAITKYYIFAFMIILLFQYKFVKIQYYHFCLLAWLALKFLSISWSWNGYNRVVRAQILSQPGMVALFCVLTVVNIDESSIRKILQMFKWFSFSVGILALFFSKSYISGTGYVAHSRKALTILGVQEDPNANAAGLLVGITLALYFALNERRNTILNLIIVAVNTFALLQTASRGGFLSLLAICTLFAVLPVEYDTLKSRLARICILIVGALFIYFVVFKYVFPDSLKRITSIESYESGSGRASIWKNSLELFFSNPLIGGGWGSYYGYNGFSYMAHNTYVQNLCDCGIIGSALFFTPIIRVFVISIKQKYYFPLLFLCAALFPAFFLDCMNLRFFWNAIILSTVILNSNMKAKLATKKEKQNKKAKPTTCRYIKTQKHLI